jgi:hypothetical protein
MPIENEEAISLIDRILGSVHFKKASDQVKIVKFLFKNRGKGKILARDIEEGAFGRGPTHPNHNPGRVRTAIVGLKLRLEDRARRLTISISAPTITASGW